MDKQAALKKIKSLVERFDEQKEFYKKTEYNETQTRRDFIDPFWKALGWDIDNEKGYAESYREVIHEDRIKVGGATKAPDYSFRLSGGKRLFFLEAKKPSVAIKDDIAPAYQVRRYGWSAKMPISIVSDFEEFAIYDCSGKPKPTDKASNGRIKYFTYENYVSEFDFIWDTFAKESVLKGSFDKFIKNDKNKKGTSTVDNEFLQSLDKWRVELAVNIALRNKNLNEDELNFIVQHTIDRLIFLRIAEDRSVEPYGNLQTDIKTGNFYQNLMFSFHQADQKYNSGLFDFQKDKISGEISIDNKVIKSIISELYYPICPYEFSVLSVEILGSAYEQFLGKQITLSKSGKAIIEEKSEVRKAGGVYYTPQYIVDYIVKNTVGKLTAGKTPKEISELKICDPACGSGSFLIGTYQFLLDWHKDYYIKLMIDNGKLIIKGNKNDVLTPSGELTTAEKKRILLNNIYGVDLDSNAVEVTKLSLLLKCMEGETKETIEAQTKLFHDRILPTLDNNIKSGNSLIDLDYYDNEIDFGEERKVKPFSWQKAFPEVFNKANEVNEKEKLSSLAQKAKHHAQKAMEYVTELEEKISHVSEAQLQYGEQGGFDCIIGNPPYVRMQTLEKSQTDFFKKKYKSAVYGNYDLYVLFIEKSLSLLNKRGLLGMILPHKFFQAEYGQGIRNIISEGKNLFQINDFTTNQIFDGATTYTCLLFLSTSENKKFSYQKLELGIDIQNALNSPNLEDIPTPKLNDKWSFKSSEKEKVFEKLHKQKTGLKDISRKIFKGSSTGNDNVYLLKRISKSSKHSTLYSSVLDENIELENELLKPFIYGSDVRKFAVNQTDIVLLFPYKIKEKATLIDYKILKSEYPLTFDYFQRTQQVLKQRKLEMTNFDFYKYSAGRSLVEYNQIKILIPDMLVESRLGIDVKGTYFHGPAIHSLVLNEESSFLHINYITALLSSKVFWFFISNTSTALSGNAYRLTPEYINTFPIKVIDPKNKTEVQQQKEIIKYVETLLQLNADKQNITLPNQIELIENRIEYIDSKVNELVYELYDLTTDEIKIISEHGK